MVGNAAMAIAALLASRRSLAYPLIGLPRKVGNYPKAADPSN
jgi:hypothetical protein